MRTLNTVWWVVVVALFAATEPVAADHIRTLQTEAVREGRSAAAHWGADPDNYTAWGNHSNRLIPVYTFGTRGAGPGVDLMSYAGENSPYRSEEALRKIYGRIPTNTLNPDADYFDQTNIADLQRAAVAAGKKYIFLVIFDGMDWQTTHAAAIHNLGNVAYRSGRGRGLHFLEYTADDTTQFGSMVVAPHNGGTVVDVDRQEVTAPGLESPGGYNAGKGGPNPWTSANDPWYLIGKDESGKGRGEHVIPDSASTATAMTSGVKTYNGAVNVDRTGHRVTTLAHELQERGWLVGAVSNVPISHATPAAAYAHNVSRNDYQDLTRDLLGLRSISHPERPLPGLDVLIGGGYGVIRDEDAGQGENYVPGNRFLTEEDLHSVDVRHGGKYTVALRTDGVNGNEALQEAAQQAADSATRLLGFYGVGRYNGHLPYETASGDYQPAPGRRGTAEEYSQADLEENPTLAQMTTAALRVLGRNRQGFWLMVEPGDVDWANHDNNLDTSIGAVNSGDAAVKVITDWVERHSNWDDALLIVTADHGHSLYLTQPELLVPAE